MEFLKIKPDANEFTANGRVLLIAPHADDELIGCHQIISSNADSTTVVYCGFLGSNPTDDNKKVRELEIKDYVASQRSSILVSSPENIKTDLSRLITDTNPSVICLPSVVDWHPEHRQINYILDEVLSSSSWRGQVLWYHVSLPIPAQYVNCYSGMSKKQHTHKWSTMKTYYPSQLHMDIKRFRFVERVLQNTVFAVETYIVQDYNQWKESLNILGNKTINETELKQSLGDIEKMFYYTFDYYKLLLYESNISSADGDCQSPKVYRSFITKAINSQSYF